MATTKTKQKNKPSATKKNHSRFYIVKSVQETKKDLTDKINAYNETYVVKPIEKGKSFAADLKKTPRKTIESLADESREMVTDMKNEGVKKFNGLVDDSKSLLTKARKAPRDTAQELIKDGKSRVRGIGKDGKEMIDSLIDDTKAFLKGIENDARIVLDDIIDESKKRLDDIPGKKRLEKEINARMAKIPAQFNLPSKKDIDQLTRRVNLLKTKVEELSKTCAV
jgi:polyhydroxyalkanoate synthesis regulator phasin